MADGPAERYSAERVKAILTDYEALRDRAMFLAEAPPYYVAIQEEERCWLNEAPADEGVRLNWCRLEYGSHDEASSIEDESGVIPFDAFALDPDVVAADREATRRRIRAEMEAERRRDAARVAAERDTYERAELARLKAKYEAGP